MWRVLTAAVCSLKGGVGKTTVVLGLASAALQRGIDCLLVDLDPQANATTTVEPAGGSATIADVLSDPRRSVVKRAVRPTSWGAGLRVLPGSEEAESHNHPDPGNKRLHRLAVALDKLDPEPELVLIDCPPSLGQLTRSGLVAARRAVLVTEPTLYSVAGVQRALEAVQAERASNNKQLQPLGVVINRVRPRAVEHEFRLGELRELFGPLVLSPSLPDRAVIQQAEGAGVPIHRWPTSGAREMAALFDQLLDRLLRSERRR